MSSVCPQIHKKRRVVGRVRCKNIKSECPKPTCPEPVLLPGRCCKICPGQDDSEFTLFCFDIHTVLQVHCIGSLCTGAFLYVPYSFLLISNKFCDLSLLHCVQSKSILPHCVQSYRTVYNLTALPPSPPQPVMGPRSSWELIYIKLPMDL